MYVCLQYKMKASIRKVCLGCRWRRNYIYNSDIILPRVKGGTCSCAALQTACKMCACLLYMPVHPSLTSSLGSCHRIYVGSRF